MSDQERFEGMAWVLFEAALKTYSKHLAPGPCCETLRVSGWKQETREVFAALLSQEFGEDALTERITEMQGQLAAAHAQIRILSGERAIFPDVVVAHA